MKLQNMSPYIKALFGCLFVVYGIFFIPGCENPITGYGPQPIYIDEQKHEPMLNIFGILRPGSKEGKPLSFIHVEKTFSITEEYPDTTVVTDAIVKLFRYDDDQISDTCRFNYTSFDAIFAASEYRHADFYPQSGKSYGVLCESNGFPELRSKTTVPTVPKIIENSIKINRDEVSFTIERDSLAALYDVWLYIGQHEYSVRLLRPEAGNINVKIDYREHSSLEGVLIVYAYDLKLSEYITYNVIFKPNTYHVSYSTVENGYGCFGSMNILEKTIEF